MKCDEVRELLLDDIRNRTCEDVRLHLQSCRECGQLERDLTLLGRLTEELKGQSRAPGSFAARVNSRIARRKFPIRLAAACALLVLMSVGINDGAEVRNPGSRTQTVRGDLKREAPAPVWKKAREAKSPPPGNSVFSVQHPDERAAGPRVADSDAPLRILIQEDRGRGYLLQLPRTIEIRQAQAEDEFYLRNISH